MTFKSIGNSSGPLVLDAGKRTYGNFKLVKSPIPDHKCKDALGQGPLPGATFPLFCSPLLSQCTQYMIQCVYQTPVIPCHMFGQV